MDGPHVIVDSISRRSERDKNGNLWQYHPRSDHHSKVSCWAILFDLLQICPLLVEHVAGGKVAFGINHPLMDFMANKQKKLDLVLCQPGDGRRGRHSFRSLAHRLDLALDDRQREKLARLPDVHEMPVGSVLMALEAKACMTEHRKAIPRLHDELSSSMRAINGSNGHAIAAGLVMINRASQFTSPLRHPVPTITRHNQPASAIAVRDEAVLKIPRRSAPNAPGFDALALIVIEAHNDGSAITLAESGPAVPSPNTTLDYAFTIRRIAQDYQARCAQL